MFSYTHGQLANELKKRTRRKKFNLGIENGPIAGSIVQGFLVICCDNKPEGWFGVEVSPRLSLCYLCGTWHTPQSFLPRLLPEQVLVLHEATCSSSLRSSV
jgi:hypothetical protein